MRFKKISPTLKQKAKEEIKMLLHASRDCLRNQEIDTTKVTFSVRDEYYAEAFGVMRGLQLLAYGKLGSDNLDGIQDSYTKYSTLQPEHNLKWWFSQIQDEVLVEEGFEKDNQCSWCYEKYFKDSVRKR